MGAVYRVYLKKIKLTNFRNYSNLDFEFIQPITVFYGNNAQGKTNFLESIYFLATSKSFKADKDEELIKTGEEVVRVEGDIESSEFRAQSSEFTNLEIVIQKTENFLKKRIKVNGIPRRLVDYSGNLVVVEFLPEDINLVAGSPSLRRNHIDAVLSQIDRGYKRTLSDYEEVIANKNRLLKRIREGFSRVDELIFWTDKQLSLGVELVEKRRAFFLFINNTERKFGEFIYEYLENSLTKERLIEYQQREIESASSLIGPHRDDFVYKLDGKDLSKYGSRGEQRTAVLDLRISEIEYIESILGSRPLLLLDDIFSELDHEHQKHVINLCEMQQTIITTVEIDEHLKKYFKDNINFYFVENGQISLRVDKL